MHADHGPDATGLLEQVRRALADDLDAPAAIAAVDAWVEDGGAPVSADQGPALAARVVDALLGIAV